MPDHPMPLPPPTATTWDRPPTCACCGHLLPRDKPVGQWQGQAAHLACQEWAERGKG